ncbi:MAG: hypothetical protein K1X53_10550 [Candidatus Sumerlaeaceae bacterium]|nr:hypothetical protein [Candidatus Sumerlaeaceae bacterium]
MGLTQHLNYHRYLFHCQFTACTTTASLTLVAFALAWVSQPVAARWKIPYRRRDWLAWAAFGPGLFAISIAAGKAMCVYVYLWGREWIVK